jgi:hypothetical protein
VGDTPFDGFFAFQICPLIAKMSINKLVVEVLFERDPSSLSTSFCNYFERFFQNRKHSNLDTNMSCIAPGCTAAESSRLEKTSGHDYDPIVQDLDEYDLCDEHRCAFSTKRNNRCTDVVAQGPVELHARARKSTHHYDLLQNPLWQRRTEAKGRIGN